MKKIFIIALLLSVTGVRVFAQASTTLSNLTSPTAVNQGLIPATENHMPIDTRQSSKGTISSSLYINGKLIVI